MVSNFLHLQNFSIRISYNIATIETPVIRSRVRSHLYDQLVDRGETVRHTKVPARLSKVAGGGKKRVNKKERRNSFQTTTAIAYM